MRLICAICFLAAALLADASQLPALSILDLEGRVVEPLDPGTKTASVLIFYGDDCPISNSYAPEINRICSAYTNFVFYIIQVDPDLTAAAAKEHRRQYQLHPTVLLDPLHRLVKQTGAKVTPEAVVIGKAGRILYRGRIDNLYAGLEQKRGGISQHDLRDALTSISAGRPVKQKETTPIGCIIE